MAQRSPAHRRALIVDDETLFALTLAEDKVAIDVGSNPGPATTEN